MENELRTQHRNQTDLNHGFTQRFYREKVDSIKLVWNDMMSWLMNREKICSSVGSILEFWTHKPYCKFNLPFVPDVLLWRAEEAHHIIHHVHTGFRSSVKCEHCEKHGSNFCSLAAGIRLVPSAIDQAGLRLRISGSSWKTNNTSQPIETEWSLINGRSLK